MYRTDIYIYIYIIYINIYIYIYIIYIYMYIYAWLSEDKWVSGYMILVICLSFSNWKTNGLLGKSIIIISECCFYMSQSREVPGHNAKQLV